MKPTPTSTKPLNKEEKRWKYFEEKISEFENNQRVFAMNMGSIARELGMSPKRFVKCLYDEDKNKKFYLKTLIVEEKLRNFGQKSLWQKLKGLFYGKKGINTRGNREEKTGEGSKESRSVSEEGREGKATAGQQELPGLSK